MSWRRLRLLVLVGLLGLLGCRGGTPQPDLQEASGQLGAKIDISLADWLKLPRASLAKLGEQWEKTIQEQRRLAREAPQSVRLLPDLRPVLIHPVFHEVKYDSRLGFIVPSYHQEGTRDAGLALHLARLGDREAALQLADPQDADLRKELDAWQTEKNYPVEWTRLVRLVQYSAELKVASGEVEGARELVGLHRQLGELLDSQAARGPLGAALLPAGRRALAEAARAWRQPKHNRAKLAEAVDRALEDWGPLPKQQAALAPGAPRDRVEARLGGSDTPTRVLMVSKPTAIRRAVDLLELPVPGQWVAGVLAFFTEDDHLQELTLVYQKRAVSELPEPFHHAHRLLERGWEGKQENKQPGLEEQLYQGDGVGYRITVLSRSRALGALVRITATGDQGGAITPGKELRALGEIHLDRSFGQHRLRLAPAQQGSQIVVRERQVLERTVSALGMSVPVQLELEQEPGEDVLASVVLRWSASANREAVHDLLIPLWKVLGPPTVSTVEDDNGGAVVFAWQSADTRLRLEVPFAEQGPELIAEDTRDASQLARRVEEVSNFDRAERQARAKAGKLDRRIDRSLGVINGLDLRGVQLGMARDRVLARLPRTRTIHQSAILDGVSLLFLEQPPRTAVYWVRQAFLRFDREGKLAELRVRYLDRLRVPDQKTPSLLQVLTARAGASPVLGTPTWKGLWADLPAQRPAPVEYRWRDDQTVLTLQRDAGGAETIVHDLPESVPADRELAPLRFCSRGVEGCQLGVSKAELEARWKNPGTMPDGGLTLEQPASSPYDVLLVWLHEDRVVRIVARHRQPRPVPAGAVNQTLQQVWSEGLDQLGAIRRQEAASAAIRGGYAWHDDVTRVRTFVQEGAQMPELLTEWRSWPIPASQ
jgi:hypothetical protein